MSDRNETKEVLIEDLALLRQEITELKTTKVAFDVQDELLRTLVSLVKAGTGPLTLRAMLQKILQIAIRLTGAEESSLFLLDGDGLVVESILARGAIIREYKRSIIGKVLEKGLAGWVIRNRKVGLISDTLTDDRWLTLPDQPYTVRSVLCVPLLRGKVLMGILTLMHSQPHHFSPESAHLMLLTAERMALVLENAQLYIEHQSNPNQSSHHNSFNQTELPIDTDNLPVEPPSGKEQPSIAEQLFKKEELSFFGIFILVGYGKFIYANPRLAEIFGYTFQEFLSLETIFDLVAVENCSLLANHLNQCFQSKRKNLCCTFQGQCKDGSFIEIEIYGLKTRFLGKSVIIGVLRATEE